MGKKNSNQSNAFRPAAASQPMATSGQSTSSPVRNTTIPKPPPMSAKPSTQRVITREMIAQRAYEISQSPKCGSEMDNWLSAERELKGA